MSVHPGLIRLSAFPLLHEMHTKSYRIWTRLSLNPNELRVFYKLEAEPKEFSKIILPALSSTPERCGKLWEQTCFECFIPLKDSDAYLEFNGSPSGDWNWYSFRSYREGMAEFPLAPESIPKQSVQNRGDSFIEVEGTLPLSGVHQGFLSAGQNALLFDRVGITAVLNTSAATTYWALGHDGSKPDFHLKSNWSAKP